MITTKKSIIFFLTAALILFTGSSMVFAAAGRPGAPWFNNESAPGRTEYEGTLYLDFVNSGRGNVPGGIGDELEGSWREEVVYINFLLVLYPIRPSAETLFFSGTAKTCEPYADPFLDLPICPEGAERYNELFYIPGDYVARIGAAALTFYRETVFPALCGSRDCGDLKYAPLDGGSGNAVDVVDPMEIPQPSPPWYYAQSVTLVTREP